MQDPVHKLVVANILALKTVGPLRNCMASYLRACMLVHATRKYELSACFEARQLLTESDVWELASAWKHADKSLARKPTSEGKCLVGAKSAIGLIIGRSNVLDSSFHVRVFMFVVPHPSG